MKILSAIGMMSGTSMDGIDLALIHSDGEQSVRTGETRFIPYSQRFQNLLREGLQDALGIKKRSERPGILRSLEQELTHIHGAALAEFLTAYHLKTEDIDLLGFHGHTVLHQPDKALTVQIGDGEALAKQIGIETIYDLRANDMKQGGQGAPLVPVYHEVLAHQLVREYDLQLPVVFVNIGGISNVTYVSDECAPIAFDCGPGNALIDEWVLAREKIAYDKDGAIAKSGSVNEAVCEQYLGHEYFKKPVPKSLDRLDFLPLVNPDITTPDGARTLAHVTARAIANSARHFPHSPKHWVICGGGANNPVILEELRAFLPDQDAKVHRADDLGIRSDAVEAQAFGYLAIRSKLGLDLTYPTTTGCRQNCSGGLIAAAGDIEPRPF